MNRTDNRTEIRKMVGPAKELEIISIDLRNSYMPNMLAISHKISHLLTQQSYENYFGNWYNYSCVYKKLRLRKVTLFAYVAWPVRG